MELHRKLTIEEFHLEGHDFNGIVKLNNGSVVELTLNLNSKSGLQEVKISSQEQLISLHKELDSLVSHINSQYANTKEEVEDELC